MVMVAPTGTNAVCEFTSDGGCMVMVAPSGTNTVCGFTSDDGYIVMVAPSGTNTVCGFTSDGDGGTQWDKYSILIYKPQPQDAEPLQIQLC